MTSCGCQRPLPDDGDEFEDFLLEEEFSQPFEEEDYLGSSNFTFPGSQSIAYGQAQVPQQQMSAAPAPASVNQPIVTSATGLSSANSDPLPALSPEEIAIAELTSGQRKLKKKDRKKLKKLRKVVAAQKQREMARYAPNPLLDTMEGDIMRNQVRRNSGKLKRSPGAARGLIAGVRKSATPALFARLRAVTQSLRGIGIRLG